MASVFLSDMKDRGQVAQATDLAGLEQHLSTGTPKDRKAYVGFDPTASSLTIGNLVGIMALARFQRAGHTPVAVMGGGTGLIGDPSGKTAERQLRTSEEIAENVASIQRIFGNILDFGSVSNQAVLVNNIDWLGKLSYLDALRDIGKHFSVNMMIQKDSVKERLTNRDQGISYTEFSYMILQAYDFEYLNRVHKVTMQMGGSDQYGNIVVGIDLIRRDQASSIEKKIQDKLAAGKIVLSEHEPTREAFGLTWPLVTKADGTKFGKTESGAIWLTAPRDAGDTSPARTSAYAYYQFWLNAADADVVRFLNTFTFLTKDKIAELAAQQQSNPGAREAQRELARKATEIIHGTTEATYAEAAAKALFSGEIGTLSLSLLNDVFASVPSSTHDKAKLGSGVGVLDLVVQTQLASSKREAKEFLAAGSVTANGRKLGVDDTLTSSDLLHGEVIALRRGKKQWHLTRWKA
jgi:tyrosyl-tRNA synthetase